MMDPLPLSLPDLTLLAKKSMVERDLFPDFPPTVLNEALLIQPLSIYNPLNIKDLRSKLWISIDNDDSKDLDQVTYAEKISDNKVKIYIAIADVASFVSSHSAIDQFAQHNTTSVYTPTKVFPMLPEHLSNHLTSLNENEDRFAIVIEITLNLHDSIDNYILYPAYIRNHAKLAYNYLATWLNGKGTIPIQISQVKGLDEQIKLQDQIAIHLKQYLQQQGSLIFETIDFHPIVKQGSIVDIKILEKNRARELIENFMIIANMVTAQFLRDKQAPCLRRVVRFPKRWDGIVKVAQKYGETLPEQPDSKALEIFLIKRRLSDPLRFPDLSLTIIKLLGRGEYILQAPQEESIGHFNLGIKYYTHSTAPNRRYIDLINQRIIKSIFQNQPIPYRFLELEYLAKHCTQKEEDAEKVERKMKKSGIILILSAKINEVFDALVTGAGPKGTWIRIFNPPTEGKLIEGFEGLEVGDLIKAKLVYVNMSLGFIDFIKV